MKLINFLIIASLLFLASVSPALAELKTFIKEYTYQASEDDSRNSSRTLALREVKRLLLEELGTYLESVTEVQNFQLTKDQIIALTAGIVKTEIIEEKWDGHSYWLKSKIAADPDNVIISIDSLRKDREKSKELEKLKKRSDELLKENERLRKELEVAGGDERQKGIVAYNKTIRDLTATEWYEKGYASGMSGNWIEAANEFSNAIELNPKFTQAYYSRGLAYDELGNYSQAIKNYDMAIEINPRYLAAYNNRGIAYDRLGNHKQAMKDYNRVIKINPELAVAYFNRGQAYKRSGKYERAIKDYDRAIKIEQKYDVAYFHKGLSYHLMGNNNQAIKNFDIAIKINPKYADAYYLRGYAYIKLGNKHQWAEDLLIAAQLGSKPAQDKLREIGVDW